jgi:hypothetical protein
LKDNNEKQRQYPCPSVPALIEAFATAFMTHEAWCEYMYQWPVFKVRREDCIRFLENFLSLYRGVRQRGPLKDRRFYHKRDLEKEIKNTIKDLQAFTYDDYQHAGAPADTPGDSRAHANKYMLLRDLENAFRTYGPAEWSREATYRALAAMMNQMQIYNAKGKDWTPSAMKKFLVHGPDSGLTLKLKFTRPNIEPWYKRPG